MLTPGKTFKLSKTTKRMLANFVDPHKRGDWKRMMIQAEMAAAIVPKTTRSDNGGPKNGGYTTGSNAATTTVE